MSAVSSAMAELEKLSGGDEIPSPAAQNEFLGYLSRLHASDPVRYCELMKSMCKEMEEGSSICDVKEEKENRTGNVALPREIRPNACFVIKTRVTSKAACTDSIVSSEGGIEEIYINVVCSKAVSAPELPNVKQGRTKEELLSAHITSGIRMQIPLFVGRMRTIDKLRERGVDVIVNTGVAEAAVKDYKFKMHLVELGLQWVENESGLKLLREWEDVLGGQIYIGGQGEDGLVPVPFPIPGSAGTKGGNNKTRNSQKAVAGVLSMNDPIDLLDALRCQQSDNEQCNSSDDPLVRLMHTKENVPKEPKKKLIMEVKKEKQSPSCMKKGFLIRKSTKNGEQTQLLYPECGSNEHGPSAYSKFMSRCKVVDTEEIAVSKEKIIAPQYLAKGPSCSPSAEVMNTTSREDVQASRSRFSNECLNNNTQKGKGGDDVELDSLLSIADPGTGNRSMDEKEEDTEDLIGEQLSSLAKLLHGSPPMTMTSVLQPHENNHKNDKVKTSSLPALIQQQQQQQQRRQPVEVALQQQQEPEGNQKYVEQQEQYQDQLLSRAAQFYSLAIKGKEAFVRVNLTVEALDNPKAIEVKASRTTLQVVMPGYDRPLVINGFPFQIDPNGVNIKAKAGRRELKMHIVAAVDDDE